MKKSLLALALIALLVLTACGGTQQAASSAPAAASTAASSAAAQDGSAAPASAEGTLRVALLLPGSINDKGWNASAYEGLKTVEKDHGVEVAYQENVAQSDMEGVFWDYASEGYDLIIGHGYQFGDAAEKVCAEFPEVDFVVLNGNNSNGTNLCSYSFTGWETGYLGGALAGLLTESNQIGAIGAEDTPAISNAMVGFQAGAAAVNPEAKVTVTYVNTWDDVAKGKETALAMIDSGSDVVTCNANAVGLGAIEAAKERGTYHIGFVDDQYEVAPEVVVNSALQSNQRLVAVVVENALAGTLKYEVNISGIADGAEGLAPWYDWEDKLDPEILSQIDQIRQDIVDGKIKSPL